uniref:Uncharacterized protein n=1 Tax=Tanacetum cinerariifolium TaxID=118510 RepID=A0A6L2NFZ7_TANCI|nr:hypothetical protein [Tanacetum cinerariifolium]
MIHLSQEVTHLEAKEIASLKKRVTKLEQRQISRILGFHPFRAGTSRRHSLGRRNLSKQKRKNLKSQQKFQDIDDLVDEEVIVKDKGSGEKGGSIAKTISIARLNISAARPEVSTAEPKTPPTTTTLFDDKDVTITDTLVKMKILKAKEKEVAFKDADDSARPIRSITTLQPLLTIDLKDKGKSILQEPEPIKKTKKRDQNQTERDAKVALKIQEDLDEEVRTERERQEEASKAALGELYDEVQAQIDADHELAVRLTHEEQEKYTVKEGSEEDEKRVGSRKKRAAGSSSKQKSPKKQKVNDQESVDSDTELKKCLMVLLDDDKAINYETLDVKSLIVDFLDRKDVLDLHKIVMERFIANDPEVSINMFIEKRYPLTKEILEKMLSWRLEAETKILIPQPTGTLIDITPPEQPKSLPVAPKAGRRKRIVTNDVEFQKKLVKASSKVCHDTDEPVRVPYEIYGKLYHLTNDEIQAHLEKEEKMKRAAEEAKLLKMSKPELIKVV